MNSTDHLAAFNEGIHRCRLIKNDLRETLTEYYPEKVRTLNVTYIATAKQIISHGEEYLSMIDTCTDEDIRTAITVDNYRAMLCSLPKRDS